MPDEEMLEAGMYEDNYIPSGFLPGPGLSREEAFNRMAAGADANLANLAICGIPIPDQLALVYEDTGIRDSESQRRTQVDRQKTPEEAREVDCFDLAETVTQLPMGYFYPGMPEARQRQLAAVISAGTPQIIDQNTPGMASSSSSNNPC